MLWSKPSSFILCFNSAACLNSSREKEGQLARATEAQRLQAQQADAALEEFQRQVELSAEKVYAEMTEQVRGLRAILVESPSLGGKVRSGLTCDSNMLTCAELAQQPDQGFRWERGPRPGVGGHTPPPGPRRKGRLLAAKSKSPGGEGSARRPSAPYRACEGQGWLCAPPGSLGGLRSAAPWWQRVERVRWTGRGVLFPPSGLPWFTLRAVPEWPFQSPVDKCGHGQNVSGFGSMGQFTGKIPRPAIFSRARLQVFLVCVCSRAIDRVVLISYSKLFSSGSSGGQRLSPVLIQVVCFIVLRNIKEFIKEYREQTPRYPSGRINNCQHCLFILKCYRCSFSLLCSSCLITLLSPLLRKTTIINLVCIISYFHMHM